MSSRLACVIRGDPVSKNKHLFVGLIAVLASQGFSQVFNDQVTKALELSSAHEPVLRVEVILADGQHCLLPGKSHRLDLPTAFVIFLYNSLSYMF